MERNSNVIRLPDLKDRTSRDERDTIETILYFFTRCEVTFAECEITAKTMAEIRKDQETGEICSYAFVHPVSTWPVTRAAGDTTGRLIVIDLGERRAFYYHADTPGR